MKSSLIGSELFHAGRQTDRHDEANSRFSQFCESAYKRTRHKRGLEGNIVSNLKDIV